MAKKSSTQEDPATLAFSAVEDALKDSVFGDSSASPDLAGRGRRHAVVNRSAVAAAARFPC